MSHNGKPPEGKPAEDPLARLELQQGDGFLSRWSRRKSEIAAGAAQPAAPPPDNDSAAAADDAEEQAIASEAAAQAKHELDDLVARLPSVDSISHDTDVTGFLDARIPDALRNAALRAAWSADPAIRDFLNDAREYALDYTVSGAAPGYGALTGSDLDLKAVVSRIFGDGAEIDEQGVETEAQPAVFVPQKIEQPNEVSDTESQPAIDALQHDPPLESVRRSATKAVISDSPQIRTDMASDMSGAAQHIRHDAALTTSNSVIFPRRGGRATPV
jgi:Protein of unknown function (DUF3306)